MKISDFAQFETFAKARIPTRKQLFVGDIGLQRTKKLLDLLGNPQEQIRIVHIAGTSGKGSTAHFISALLECHGFSVGLSISPHIHDIRERFQIDRRLLAKEKIVAYFNEILPYIEKMETEFLGSPTYFEILTVLAFHIFRKEKVSYAVIETGLGGLLDATNCIVSRTKLSLITRLGLDHTEILGDTLEQIATQKAGIITPGSHAITIRQQTATTEVLSKIARAKNAELELVTDPRNYSTARVTDDATEFDFNWKDIYFPRLSLATSGFHQVENCALALAAAAYLARRDFFSLEEISVRKTLSSLLIPGRMEQLKINGKKIILDGAHNPQKITALTESLQEMYHGRKLALIVGFKNSKDWKKMLDKLKPLDADLTATTFSSTAKDMAVLPEEIASYATSKGFVRVSIAQNLGNSLLGIIDEAPDTIVITGSFHLLAHARCILQKMRLLP